MNILITGASRGIGLAEAKLFAQPGNRLFLVGSSDKSFKETIQNATIIGADLSTREGVQKVVKALGDEALDLFVSNVGNMVMKKFEEFDDDEIEQVLGVNLQSHLLLSRAVLPLLRKSDNPQIVFMSSMAAKSAIVGESVYATTKYGLTGFANVLRNELGKQVRVSTVHAWGVDTWGAPHPHTFIKPEDVAEVVRFIVTRPASMMVESIDLGNPAQWRGGQAPWSPK